MPPLRLRIPPALAVAVLGGAATLAMSFPACHDPVPPEPPDAGQIQFERDASLDGHVGSTGDGTIADAGITDARPDDTPVDAYVPPDTPVG
jgi:hypothetical protein